jgi:hypothetical protein
LEQDRLIGRHELNSDRQTVRRGAELDDVIALQPVTFASDVQSVVANSTSKKACVVPPLDPPGVIDGDHGFTVGPNS